MSVVFQKGERLTASKLNSLAGMVASAERSSQALGTQMTEGEGAPFPQRSFTTYIPPLAPVYVDKASSVLGAPQSDGWVYRGGQNGDALTTLQGGGLTETSVWEKMTTDATGEITNIELGVGQPPAEQSRVPGTRGGTYVQTVGTLKKDAGKAGLPSSTWRFFDYKRPPVPPTLNSVRAPATNVISLVPPNGNTGPSARNNVDILAIESDGGLVSEAAAGAVMVQPRFELVAAPDTAAVPPESGYEPYAPGTAWQELGSVEIAGGTLTLSALWVRPWKAFISLQYNGGNSFPPGLYSAAHNTVIPWSQMVPGSLVRLSYSSDTTLGVSAFTFGGGYLSFIVDRS